MGPWTDLNLRKSCANRFKSFETAKKRPKTRFSEFWNLPFTWFGHFFQGYFRKKWPNLTCECINNQVPPIGKGQKAQNSVFEILLLIQCHCPLLTRNSATVCCTAVCKIAVWTTVFQVENQVFARKSLILARYFDKNPQNIWNVSQISQGGHSFRVHDRVHEIFSCISCRLSNFTRKIHEITVIQLGFLPNSNMIWKNLGSIK